MKKIKLLAMILTAAIACSASLTANAKAAPQTSGAHINMFGDANGDGSVLSDDALFTLRVSADAEDTPDEADSYFLDVDDDFLITSSDAVITLRESVGMGENELPDPDRPDDLSAKYAMNRFSAELFGNYCAEHKNENAVISPMSVYYALAMLENGANGSTQREIQNVLYKGADENTLNSELSQMMDHYNEGDILQLANAVYVTDRKDVVMGPNFRNNIVNFYKGDVFIKPATPETAKFLNGWISDKTNNMINDVFKPDSLDENTVSVLINALHFKADWFTPFAEDDVWKGDFHNSDGTVTNCEFLHDFDMNVFYEDDKAVAIRKWYEGDYSFIGILPNDDVGVDGYIESMDKDTISNLFSNPNYDYEVHMAIPKLDLDFDESLKEIIYDMGIRDAMSPFDADLRRVAKVRDDRNIYVDEIRHLTKLKLDENGTEAAAVTIIEMKDIASCFTEVKYIYLDKPFIFVIYDEKNNIPVFMGVVNTLEKD